MTRRAGERRASRDARDRAAKRGARVDKADDATTKHATLPSASAESFDATGPAAEAKSNRWLGYWLAPVAAVRPWLIAKTTLFLLAFDVLDTHLGPAWRYGAAGFNVPHFDWMRALPAPTTSSYVCMLFLVGIGALVAALLPRPPRALVLAVAGLYTWGWACSMHDSYQHHYLMSFVIASFALLPPFDAKTMFGTASSPRDAPHGLVPRMHALGSTFLTSLCAIVYGYTALAKTEPDWLSGAAMRNITNDGATIRGAIEFAASFGVEREAFWWWLGHGVVPAQIVIAVGYALAPLRDGPSTLREREELARLASRTFDAGGRGPLLVGSVVVAALVGAVMASAIGWGAFGALAAALVAGCVVGVALGDRDLRRFLFAPFGRPSLRGLVATLALVTAVSFHVGAEYLALSIGWFSYYMIAIALATFLPARWLSLAAFVATAPIRGKSWSSNVPEPVRWVLAVLAGVASLVVLGQVADLPGAEGASAIAVTVLVGVAIGAAGGLVARSRSIQIALACAVAGLAHAGWLNATDARFDFYRFAGGDFRRRLEYEAALESYVRANRYAPPGQRRDDRIEEMRERIRQRRGRAGD